MNERNDIVQCSIFDTIRLIGEGSTYHNKIVVVLHKELDIVYGVVQGTQEQLTIDDSFDSQITHYDFITNIVDTQILVEEVIQEKDESAVIYLDETVYSELFEYVSSHPTYSTFALEKREHMTQVLFLMLKSFQKKDDANEWQTGVRDAKQLYLRLIDEYGILSSSFARPTIEITKDKIEENGTIRFLDSAQNPLEHVCSALPPMRSGVEYIRTIPGKDKGHQESEYIVRESQPYVLMNNSLESEFKFRNMYKSGKHTACSSQTGNDRLYYTDLSKTNTKDEAENDFARVVYYPYVRRYPDKNAPIEVEGYSFQKPNVCDETFDTRFIEAYVKPDANVQYIVHPLRSRCSTLQKVVKNGRSNEGGNKDRATVQKIENIVSLKNIYKRHETEIKAFTNPSQFDELLSRYHTESSMVTSEFSKLIGEHIKKRITQIEKTIEKKQKKCDAVIDTWSRYGSLLTDVIKMFMSLIQNKSDYTDINKTLSKAIASLRELQSGTKKDDIDIGIDSQHLYPWLYTSLCQSHEYSSFFDHIYGDEIQTQKSNETLNSLIQTVLSVYEFDGVSETLPVYNFNKAHLLSTCDVRNMKTMYTLMTSRDSGKLFVNLLKSRQNFEYIVNLKNELLAFGKKRFEHKYRNVTGDEKPSWDDLTDTEKLAHSPNKQYIQSVFRNIVAPLLRTFEAMPRGLCSQHNVVRVYSSEQEMLQDAEKPRTDTNTTFSKSIMKTIQSMLEGKQGSETVIDDAMFDTIYYDVTDKSKMNVRQSRLIRPGEYVSVKGLNVLFQWTGTSWLKEEIDFQNELQQCPYNFNSVQEIDWGKLRQEGVNIQERSLDELCVHEERLQECLPYPLYRMFQFILKMYSRYYEIASNVENIEQKYNAIVRAMEDAVSQNPVTRKTFQKKAAVSGDTRSPFSHRLDDILRRILEAELYTESQLHACRELMAFVREHRDTERETDDGFVYWKFSHQRLCGHWLTFAGSFIQNPSLMNNGSTKEREGVLYTYFNKWPCDSYGFCVHCGSSVNHLKNEIMGTEWEQLHDGKEAVMMTQESEPEDDINTGTVLNMMSREEKDTQKRVETFVNMFRNTMGISKMDDNFSLLCTNMILPRVTLKTYEEFTQELQASDPKIEKRKANIEKDRQKYASLAGADAAFFHTDDSSLLDFFRRRMPEEKPKKQKRISKHIQALEWLQSYYVNYAEEQYVLAVLGAFYIHVALRSPSFTIRKKDSMSDVRVSVRTYHDMVNKKYTFVKTMSLFLQKLLATPTDLEWPSHRTRLRMSAKLKAAVDRGVARDDVTFSVYGKTLIAYIEQLQTIYPYFDTLKETKAEEEKNRLQEVAQTLSSFRPVYDRSQIVVQDQENKLMTLIENKINTADIIPYNTTSCLFPYVQNPEISHPYIHSLLGEIPSLLTQKTRTSKNGERRRWFVPHPKVHMPRGTGYDFLEIHTTAYVESRYKRLMQNFASSGDRITYRPIPVSEGLLHLTEYHDFQENDSLASSYHPAIVQAIAEKSDSIHRDLHYREGALFKNDDSLALDGGKFQERIFAWRKKNMVRPRDFDREQEPPKTFQEQIHAISTLWNDSENRVFASLRSETEPSQTFFKKRKRPNDTSEKNDRMMIISRFERIVEAECKENGKVIELRTLIDQENVTAADITTLGNILSSIITYLSSLTHGSWDSLVNDYFPATKKNMQDQELSVGVDEFLQNQLLMMRTMHTTSFDIQRHLVKRFKDTHIQMDSVRKELQPLSHLVHMLQTMNMSSYDKDELRCLYLICVYILVNQINEISRTNLSTYTARKLMKVCLQQIEERSLIRNLDKSNIMAMQQYIDQKNNSSRVRFIERLKVIDPALENSHYMFRRNNLGNIAHVDFEEQNELTTDNDDSWMEIDREEEGYTTLLEEE